MKPFKIWCKNKEILYQVLTKMEAEQIRWITDRLPTEKEFSRDLIPLGLYVNEDFQLTWDNNKVFFNDTYEPEITPEEYLGGKKEMKKTDLSIEKQEAINNLMDYIMENCDDTRVRILEEFITSNTYKLVDNSDFMSEFKHVFPEITTNRTAKIVYKAVEEMGMDIKTTKFTKLYAKYKDAIDPLVHKGGKKEMEKSDLRTGHIVTTREGNEYMVYLDIDTEYTDFNGKDVLVGTGVSWNSLEYYNEDLTYHDEREEFDIVKVERGVHPYCLQDISHGKAKREILWEREKEPKEMTVAEIEKLLGYPVKIVK